MTIAASRISKAFLVLASAVYLGIAVAQPVTTGFSDTDALFSRANELAAQVLAPKSYAAAEKSYQTARKNTEAGRSDTASKYLVKANNYLRQAIESAKLAEIIFADALAARERAIAANAATYEPALWSDAEQELAGGARKLEAGDRRGSNADGLNAARLYGSAELAAIKTGIVGNARVLIAEAEADPAKVNRNAPITLAQAKSLVAQAEAAIDVDRYDTARPQELAAEAEYQAKHAMYLAGQAAMLSARQITAEELILKWEQPLRDVAAALDVTTDMSAGYSAAGTAALARANSIMAATGPANAAVSAPAVQAVAAEPVAHDPDTAARKLAELEAMFAREQAQVLLDGDNIVLRLTGLIFPRGQSVVETKYFGLLTAVQESLAIFPESYVIIEGHTDSQGEETANLILSQQRANAVRSYLIASSGISPTQVSAEGYGESNPVATNMYGYGRVQNERIDIVLQDAWSGSQPTARIRR